jgi:penicillin-binding protein 2
MTVKRDVRASQDIHRRIFLLSVAAALVFFVLLSRLWFLQFIQSDRLRELSENNRLRFMPVAASRGVILDRNGKLLVTNTPSYSLAVIPYDVRDKDALLDSLTRILGADRQELVRRWDKSRGRARYLPVVLAGGITRDQLEYLAENALRLPGTEVEVKPVREYPNGQLAAHLLGHIGEISEQEMESSAFSDYNPGDYVGKSGVERSWETYLHGDDGGRQIEVDARGRYLRTVSESEPVTGQSVVLTIDLDLQKAVERSLGDKAASAVVMEVASGEILAFASNPTFDPALFAGRMPPDIWDAYLKDQRHPLENKALKGQYPPGSTFKAITALAGLSEGLIDERTTVDCSGEYKIGTTVFRCWNKKGHGRVDLRGALRESCDVYFYQLGEKLGVDRIARVAREFGVGEPLGIGLENEKGGFMPTAAWKERKTGKKWYRGDTLPVSIGQGYVLMTPIQLAAMTAGLASDGQIFRPHLVKRIVDRDGRTIKEFKPELLKRVSIEPRHFKLVREGFLAVVNEPRGTGGAARLYEVKVAGKTGTSQVVKMREGRRDIPYQYRDHALFVAFAPYDKPEVAVAVVVEHGEHGGAAAAPVAGRILRSYFEGKGVIRSPAAAEGEDEEDPAPQPERPAPQGETR